MKRDGPRLPPPMSGAPLGPLGRLAPLAVLLVALGVGALVLVASRADHQGRASDKALEAAILAPCCFNGTLASHDSPLAHDLRAEIESRYARGESTKIIEDDLVARYGPEVRAMPNEQAFTLVPALAAFVGTLALGLLGLFVRRTRRQDRTERAERAEHGRHDASPAPRDAYDARIDAELAELE